MDMAIASFRKLTHGKPGLRWSGGGLLALVSVGLHGVLLGLPMAEPTPKDPDSLAAIAAPVALPGATIDVVRLPAPPPAIDPPPAVTPSADATPARPVAPLASAPRAQATAPAPSTPARPTPPPLGETAAIQPLAPHRLPAEPPPQTLEDRLNDPAAYVFNQQAKSLLANEITFHMAVVPSWLEAESQGLGNDDVPVMGQKLPPLQVVLPVRTCLTPPPAEGLVGVIVRSDGQRLKAPQLLDSTGYTVLDEKALELVLQRTFEPQSGPLPNPRAHWLPIQVQYDPAACSP
jgi:hypothetical protein